MDVDATPRRRADAQRNIAAILDAALTCFATDPQATMADIAQAAGVGRMTLYGHFPSRDQLVAAVLDSAVAEAEAALAAGPTDDTPADQAVAALLRSSWQVLDRHRALFAAAHTTLGHEQLRQHHNAVMSRFDQLIARGQAEGVIRSDLPRDWLVSVVFGLLHAAAEDVNARRLPHTDAGDVLQATVLAALAPQPAGRRRTR